jgi:hypothetical protein
MRHGIVLFTSDRGITPAQAAVAAEERGFDARATSTASRAACKAERAT